MAMCVMAVVGVAPCQCFSPGGTNDVAGADFLDGAARALRPAAAGGDDQRLAERMRVPGGARAGLEGDAGAAARAPGSGGSKSGSMRTVPVNQSAGPLPEGWVPLRLMSMPAFLAE